MKIRSWIGLAVFAISASSAFANLIPIYVVPNTGNGLGNVYSVVTFQNTGSETGCVGFVGGATGTGPTQCFGGVVGPTHEITGSGNNTYTANFLGIAPTGANTFSNLILIFNGNEGGNLIDEPFTITKLSLNLFDSGGFVLGAFPTINSFSASGFPGIGNAGFGFQLDAAQAAQANAFLASNPSLVIGASISVSDTQGGPDTLFISRIDSVQPPPDDTGGVPEPTTLFLTGLGLVGVELFRRKQARKD